MGFRTAATARVASRSRQETGFATRLLDHLLVPTFALDCTRSVIVWNKACERLTGIEAGEMLGTSEHWRAFHESPTPCLADLIVEGRVAEMAEQFRNFERFAMSDHGVSVEGCYEMPRLRRQVHLAIEAGPIYGSSGSLVAVVETLRDVTAQRNTQVALESLAALDSLTGLANRRSFDNALKSAVHRAVKERAPLSLLMIDVDSFKAYNDSQGHQQGDHCLKSLAGRFKSVLRGANDVAARYGGEEFAIILPEVTRAGAELVAERVRRAVHDLNLPHAASTVSDRVTLSIGGVSALGTDLDEQLLVSSADEALYKAKRGGRDRSMFVEYEPSYLF